MRSVTLSSFGDVLGQHVGLDVHPVAGPERPERGDGQGVRDEHDREAVGRDVDQGQAHAVDGDRALRDHQRGPGRVDREGEELPLALGPALAEVGRGVDVPLDEVAAEAVADAERPLQVHRGRRRACSPRFVRSRVSGPAWTSNALALGGDDRQAAAVDRDALADRQRRRPGPARPGERQATARALLVDPLDPPQRLDQSREHADLSRVPTRPRPRRAGRPGLRMVARPRARVRIGGIAIARPSRASALDRPHESREDRRHDTAPEPPRLPRPGDRRDHRPGRRVRGHRLGRRPRRRDLPKSPTDKVTLGKTGIQVSLVGMGTGSVGSGQASNQTRLGVKEFTRVVRHALDRGVCLLRRRRPVRLARLSPRGPQGRPPRPVRDPDQDPRDQVRRRQQPPRALPAWSWASTTSTSSCSTA